MARNLSWIDPEKLASLLEVVSATRPKSARSDGEESGAPPENMVQTGVFPVARSRAAAGAERPAPAPRPAAPDPSVRARTVAAPAVATPAPTAPAPRTMTPATSAPAARPAVPTPAAPPARAAAPAPAAPAPAAPAPAAPAASEFMPSRGADLGARLEEFLEWVVPATQSRGALITDAHGLVVVERHTNEVEPVMTTSIDLMLSHLADLVQSDLDGYVALQRNGLHLVTLWTPTEHGRFFGVLISETAPPRESIALAGQGLRTLFAN